MTDRDPDHLEWNSKPSHHGHTVISQAYLNLESSDNAIIFLKIISLNEPGKYIGIFLVNSSRFQKLDTVTPVP